MIRFLRNKQDKIIFSKSVIYFVCMGVFVCMLGVCVCVVQKRASEPSEVELQRVVNWVLNAGPLEGRPGLLARSRQHRDLVFVSSPFPRAQMTSSLYISLGFIFCLFQMGSHLSQAGLRLHV